MTRLARAFVAITPPAAVLDALDARLQPVRPIATGLRWLPRAQWHLTLQFLGAVPDAGALQAAVAAVAARSAPFSAQLAGAGAFPRPRRASVAWVGVADPVPLAALAATVAAATAPLGFRADDRPYRPHLSVARSSRATPMTDVVEGIGAEAIGTTFAVDEIAVIESDTRPDAAVHTVRSRLPLEGA